MIFFIMIINGSSETESEKDLVRLHAQLQMLESEIKKRSSDMIEYMKNLKEKEYEETPPPKKEEKK